MRWVRGGPDMDEDLNALLHFFVQITKETPKAYVTLATSDFSVLTWLQASEPFAPFSLQPLPQSSSSLSLHAELRDDLFRCEVIGDFPETEARTSLQHVVGKLPSVDNDWESMHPDEDQYWSSWSESTPQWVMGGPVADQDWAHIYEVCGGNVGFLISTASSFEGEWDKALCKIWALPMNSVSKGLAGGPGWSRGQYALVVDRLAKAPFGAVIAEDLYAKLDSAWEAAKEVVEAMAQARVVAYRPASDWANDIPVEAFGPIRQEVVTAPTATHLYCMRRLQKRGPLKKVAEEQGALKKAAEAVYITPAAASDLYQLDRQIMDLNCQISSMVVDISYLDQQTDYVDSQISMVIRKGKEMHSTKPDGWENEIAYLHEKERQLRDNKKQLREKGRQLREEEQQLCEEELKLREELLLLRKSDT